MKFAFIDVFIVFAVILLMVIPGYVIRKKKMVDKNSISTLSIILLYVFQPFITIKAFTLSKVEPSKELAINMLIVLLLTFIIHFILFLVLKLYFIKQKEKKKGSYMICSLFSNASFIGVVFVEMIVKDDTAVIYATIFMCVFNMLIWTIGVYFLTGEIKMMKPLRGILNPAVLVLIIVVPMFFIPSINIFKIVEMLGEGVKFFAFANLPISMIIVGIRMADLSMREIFKNPQLYLVSLFKLLIAPVITFLLLLPFLLFDVFASIDSENYIILVLVIIMALPTAATSIPMSEKFKGDVDLTVEGFVLCTLLSIVTVPILLMLLTHIIN